MKTCSNCGTVCPEDAAFCPNCGAALSLQPTAPEPAAPVAPAQPPAPAAAPTQPVSPPMQPTTPPSPYAQPPAQPNPAPSPYTQPPMQPNSAPYGQPSAPGYPDYPYQQPKRNAPLVLGIVGIVFAILLPLVTYCCSIPGLVMASKDIQRGLPSQSARVLNIIALALAVANSFLGIVLRLV